MIFFLYFRKNEYPCHRFAISVNRKIGNAVERNYIKRQMKELFRLNCHRVRSHFDFWIVIKKTFHRPDRHIIGEIFINMLNQVNSKYAND